ncbi:MAG: site-specific integrase [Bacillota bacterium]|nr:MAG: site-specific integrase [Bacillota bacterium]
MVSGHVEWRNGRPSLVIDRGIGPDGKRDRDRLGPRRLKEVGLPIPRSDKEAEALLRKILVHIDEGTYVEPSSETVASFLARWLRLAAPGRRPSTMRRYRVNIERHVVPALGQRRLAAVTNLQVSELYAALIEGGLAASTVRGVHRLLRLAFGDAVRWGLLARNPTDGASLPMAEERERPALTPDRARRMMDQLCGHRDELAVALGLYLGLRRSEVLGLRREDVDLERAVLQVRRGVTRLPNEPPVLGPVKTKSGQRLLPMPAGLVEIARRALREQAERRLAAGPAYHDQGLLVCAEDGSPLAPDSLTARFRVISRRLGLGITFHGLRHSCASFLLAQKVPPKVVQHILGHSSIRITMDLYAHLMPGSTAEAAVAMDQALGHRMGTDGPPGSRAARSRRR